MTGDPDDRSTGALQEPVAVRIEVDRDHRPPTVRGHATTTDAPGRTTSAASAAADVSPGRSTGDVHAPPGDRVELCSAYVPGPVARNHTAVARPSPPRTTCGCTAAAPGADTGTGTPQDPPAGRLEATTCGSPPVAWVHTATALPAASRSTAPASPEVTAGATEPAGSQVGAAATSTTGASAPTRATTVTTMPLRALRRTTGP